jgi:hypothetical protein
VCVCVCVCVCVLDVLDVLDTSYKKVTSTGAPY